jgi:predicted N-acetyltransferase YhbS
MMSSLALRPQMAADTPQIDALHDEVFGPGRFVRTAYRIREASTVAPLLSLIAWQGDTLAGAMLLTAISIGGRRGAVLLGPLAIAPAFQHKGLGMRLILESKAQLAAMSYELIILVGDALYYARAGFHVVPQGQIALPGPADPARFLGCELVHGALDHYRGMTTADNEPPFTLNAHTLLRSA